MNTVAVQVVLEQKVRALAAFAVVPAATVVAWGLDGTTTIDVTLDGVYLGRRSLHRWDDDRWFVEIPRPQLAAVGKRVGDRATLTLRVASTKLPAELQALIDADPDAAARWRAHTPAQQRMLREEILAAKTAATRERRARRALLPPTPAPVEVPGLGTAARGVVLRIEGRELPGTACGPYTEVRVGLPEGSTVPRELVPADVPAVRFETRIEVRAGKDRPAFRGPAVNGPPSERFVYLVWIGRLAGGPPATFRRAKIRLDAVPADVLAAAVATGFLVASLGLTDDKGMPRCASVRPPLVTWSAERPSR